MGKFWSGFVVGIVALFVAVILSAVAGIIPVATNSGPLPMERWLAKTALHAKLRSARGVLSPIRPTEANLLAGAKIYNTHCAVCHGSHQHPVTAISMGMYPPPPALWTQRGMVNGDPVGVTHWKVQNGIRLTGMPSFSGSLSSTQMWQVSLLLRNANHLPASVTAALAPQPATTAPQSH